MGITDFFMGKEQRAGQKSVHEYNDVNVELFYDKIMGILEQLGFEIDNVNSFKKKYSAEYSSAIDGRIKATRQMGGFFDKQPWEAVTIHILGHNHSNVVLNMEVSSHVVNLPNEIVAEIDTYFGRAKQNG